MKCKHRDAVPGRAGKPARSNIPAPWIRTTDRLPEPDILVLGWFRYGEPEFQSCRFSPAQWKDPTVCWTLATGESCVPPDDWMPILAPADASEGGS